MRSSIINLSFAQTIGIAVTAAGGAAVWFVAAALAPAADLGVLGRVVSTSTLVAGLVTSGFGQFLLVVARTSDVAQLRRYLVRSLVVGGVLSLVATLALGVVHGGPPAVMVAAALLALGIALTNLQDAAYLSTGMVYDVPVKGIVLIVARLLLLALTALDPRHFTLVLAFVGSQLAVGGGWILVRLSTALRRHAPHVPEPSGGTWGALAVSYLYASCVACITSGVPALITSVVSPPEAGAFYLIWTITGLMSGCAIAIANAVLVVSHDATFQRLSKLFATLFALLASAGALLALAAPLLLTLFHRDLSGADTVFGRLIIGQIGFGMVVGALAVLRRARTTLRGQRSAARWLPVGLLIVWPVLVVGGVWLGLRTGLAGAALAFMVCNVLAAGGSCGLALWTAWASAHGATARAGDGPLEGRSAHQRIAGAHHDKSKVLS